MISLDTVRSWNLYNHSKTPLSSLMPCQWCVHYSMAAGDEKWCLRRWQTALFVRKKGRMDRTKLVMAKISLTARNKHTWQGKAILIRDQGAGRGTDLMFTKHCLCVPCFISLFNPCEVFFIFSLQLREKFKYFFPRSQSCKTIELGTVYTSPYPTLPCQCNLSGSFSPAQLLEKVCSLWKVLFNTLYFSILIYKK